ncbi:MAG: DUF116 domain-containing protein [Desulfobulbaceae bacterium]|nr:DUF116 domain-containing protein [Desulfobulbaceae bacterium]
MAHTNHFFFRILMRLIPSAIALPFLVYLYRPLKRYFPKIDKDWYARNVVDAANNFFYKKFIAVPFTERILFLPYCLRPLTCPTLIDQQEGLQCPEDCAIPCKLRETKELALDLGYRDARIVVSGKLHKKQGVLRSKDFLVRQIELFQPKAVIGCLCTTDFCNKYLHPENLSPSGTKGKKHGMKVVPQIVLLESPNCRQSSINWQTLSDTITACKNP